MISFIAKRTRLRFFLALALLALITYLFWTSSRYPALDDKAMMGGEIHLEDPLSFEAHWTIELDFPLWKKIIYTTGNWLHTNRQGMFFGILMGAIFLTLMRYLQRMSFKSGFLNSVLGMFLGAPLGVCVNCAAPIAKGLYSGGARAETMLSAMLASPTLNIVVLTMLFSILPFYMAITKVMLCIAVILIVVPIICRFLPEEQRQLPPEEQRFCELPPLEAQGKGEKFGLALKGFASDFVSDLWYIIRLTVPLMVMAGFLGAVVATLVPIEMLNDLKFGIVGLLIIAVIGTFLPVPIAFDVVICGALLAGGLAVGSVMTLLFTLGIFSIYSFFIVGQSISLRAASMLGVSVILIGVGAGFTVDKWHADKSRRALDILSQASAPAAQVADADQPRIASELKVSAATALSTDGAQITIDRTVFNPRSAAGAKPFTRTEAHNVGIDKPIEFSFRDMWPPFWEGRSISAGDFDRDGDNDLVLASTHKGLYFYAGDGAGQFKRTDIPLGEIADWPVFNAALIDFNNDGWLDIFIATYRKGNYILWNEAGDFSKNKISPVANNSKAMLSLSLSFGDIDRDGDIDAAIGNWAAGWYRRIPGEESRNRIIKNEKGRLTGKSFTDLPGLPGETLSVLLSDINNDNALDLLVGNDFEIPDIYYYGKSDGGFAPIAAADNIIPVTTNTTMGIKSHDLDNDLVPEIYSVQIAGRASGISRRLKMQPMDKYCEDIEKEKARALCQKNMDIKDWYKSGNNFNPAYAGKCLQLEPTDQAECKAMLIKDLAIQGNDPSICELIKADQDIIRAFCDIHFKPGRPLTKSDIRGSYPQIKKRNVLLKRQASGTYEDATTAHGLEVGGWSWDTKIADFNNDEWADVYIVNGTWVPNEFTPSNMFYLNDAPLNEGSAKFSEKAAEFGLDDYLMTAAAARLDIDHDGDLDVITIPVNGPVQAFINNSQSGNAISFRLRDEVGNHFGLGAKIIIHYGEQGQRHQIREIQSGGGFQSFDTSDVHFGLGNYGEITRAVIKWIDGSETIIDEPLSAGATYTINRQRP